MDLDPLMVHLVILMILTDIKHKPIGQLHSGEGKWAIHPSQIELANEVMSPSEKEVNQAKRILEAMETAKKEGKGAVSLDGRLIDIASIRQAEVLVQKAKLIESS